ncbi:hypothetical protein BN129_3917 [Cronobacter sakazakii 701]|nr:hypothetical protein BN129_3917 [Cronobacter sakazakii 701]
MKPGGKKQLLALTTRQAVRAAARNRCPQALSDTDTQK